MSKVLARRQSKVIVHTFVDGATIEETSLNSYKVTVDGVSETIVGVDLLEVVEGITLPEDYEHWKYIINSGECELNPNWDNIVANRAAKQAFRDAEKDLHPQPYSSWTWDNDVSMWKPPVAYPADYNWEDPNYDWDEDNQTWVERE